ncbi:hypothetical protein ACFVDQ_18425 [Streptomyces sp. NPDC057684]|uniref:hypothetical protein n=1 Tax=Streptomyces sp. NPDC057684 TaxID=3346211 RepID=UPI00367972CC
MHRTGQDSTDPGSGQGARGKSPEELKRRREQEMSRERGEDEMRDEELSTTRSRTVVNDRACCSNHHWL